MGDWRPLVADRSPVSPSRVRIKYFTGRKPKSTGEGFWCGATKSPIRRKCVTVGPTTLSATFLAAGAFPPGLFDFPWGLQRELQNHKGWTDPTRPSSDWFWNKIGKTEICST